MFTREQHATNATISLAHYQGGAASRISMAHRTSIEVDAVRFARAAAMCCA
jgi:hypothetical protein